MQNNKKVEQTVIIDFHTHAFPNALAPYARKSLLDGCEHIYTPVTDMTVTGLIEHMDVSGIDMSIVQPVITKPSQTKTLNEWAKSIESDRLISFGGVHPDTLDFKQDIDFICSLGLKGIKFHPEYQNFYVDEPKMLKFYDYALSKGLILLFHAGYDPAYPPPFKSSPQMFKFIVNEMKGGTIVAAHLGGQVQWDDVLNHLAGEDIYLDTSMGFEFFSKEIFLRIVKKHKAEKILFGSDSPWSDAGKEIGIIKTLKLSDDEKKGILGKNAQRILNISGKSI